MKHSITWIAAAVFFCALATGAGAQVESQYFGEPATFETLASMRLAGHWTPEAKRVLSQALLGEAGAHRRWERRGRRVVGCSGDGCSENIDWRLIPWVLLKRWEDVRANGSRITFAGMVRAYSAPVRPRLASAERLASARLEGNTSEVSQILRRQWLQSIRFDGSNLGRLRRRYRRREPAEVVEGGWSEITSIVEAWGRGEIENPCENARHWDGLSATPRVQMVRIDCGNTLNAFWAVPRDRARAPARPPARSSGAQAPVRQSER